MEKLPLPAALQGQQDIFQKAAEAELRKTLEAEKAKLTKATDRPWLAALLRYLADEIEREAATAAKP